MDLHDAYVSESANHGPFREIDVIGKFFRSALEEFAGNVLPVIVASPYFYRNGPKASMHSIGTGLALEI